MQARCRPSHDRVRPRFAILILIPSPHSKTGHTDLWLVSHAKRTTAKSQWACRASAFRSRCRSVGWTMCTEPGPPPQPVRRADVRRSWRERSGDRHGGESSGEEMETVVRQPDSKTKRNQCVTVAHRKRHEPQFTTAQRARPPGRAAEQYRRLHNDRDMARQQMLKHAAWGINSIFVLGWGKHAPYPWKFTDLPAGRLLKIILTLPKQRPRIRGTLAGHRSGPAT